MCSISVRGFLHYGMPLIISHAYPLSLFFKYMKEMNERKDDKRYIYIIKFLVVIYSFTLIVFVVTNLESFIKSISVYEPSEFDISVVNEIKYYTETGDRILVLGHGSRIYYDSDRLCSSKYFIQEPIYDNDIYIYDDMKENLNFILPTVLVNYFSEEDGVYYTFFEHMDEYELVDKFTRLYIKIDK